MEGGGEGRPIQPILSQPGRERDGQLFQGNDRAQLAQNFRAALLQETKGRGNPALWLRFKTKNMLKEAIGTKASEEKQQFFRDAFNAYSILAYNHIPEDERPSVAMDLATWAPHEGVTIEDGSPVQTLIEAMAEATDIPYTPGQTRFDLPDAEKRY